MSKKKNSNNLVTKDYLNERLVQNNRILRSELNEDFDIKLEEKFKKYMDKVTRGLDKVMGELETVR